MIMFVDDKPLTNVVHNVSAILSGTKGCMPHQVSSVPHQVIGILEPHRDLAEQVGGQPMLLIGHDQTYRLARLGTQVIPIGHRCSL
jgi:hypothetical protein